MGPQLDVLNRSPHAGSNENGSAPQASAKGPLKLLLLGIVAYAFFYWLLPFAIQHLGLFQHHDEMAARLGETFGESRYERRCELIGIACLMAATLLAAAQFVLRRRAAQKDAAKDNFLTRLLSNMLDGIWPNY